jgi:hypothetical protein
MSLMGIPSTVAYTNNAPFTLKDYDDIAENIRDSVILRSWK